MGTAFDVPIGECTDVPMGTAVNVSAEADDDVLMC